MAAVLNALKVSAIDSALDFETPPKFSTPFCKDGVVFPVTGPGVAALNKPVHRLGRGGATWGGTLGSSVSVGWVVGC